MKRVLETAWADRLLAAGGLLLLVLTGVNLVTETGNQTLAIQADHGQREINESVQWTRANNQLVEALVNAAVQADDAAIRELLATNGVTFRVRPTDEHRP